MIYKGDDFLQKKIYFWIEDREGKSGHTFWKILMQSICPNVIVESKENNSKLLKAVKNLEDKNNKYIIAFDNSFDNMQVLHEHQLLQQYIEQKENVREIDIICFEYILLEFEKLIEWIYAPEDEFLGKRTKAVLAREKLLEVVKYRKIDYKDVPEIIEYNKEIIFYNIEQLAAKLLFDLTRNTGFEVLKGRIGDCWFKECCEWSNRNEDDICGLDDRRLSIEEKMYAIYKFTSIASEFQKVGLEVSV